MRREILCDCGHVMRAKNDEELFDIVRRHVDDKHIDLGYSDQDVLELIAKDAYNV
jgi:predicted small metal-binding protein